VVVEDNPRYSRQERLAEVGPAGQERIVRSTAVVRGTRGADVECLYLLRAGVGQVIASETEAPEPFVHSAAFEFDAARDVAAGAWRALRTLRTTLGIGP
jgi:molybdopterin/thiamine biosynthesis adenylyltransferase